MVLDKEPAIGKDTLLYFGGCAFHSSLLEYREYDSEFLIIVSASALLLDMNVSTFTVKTEPAVLETEDPVRLLAETEFVVGSERPALDPQILFGHCSLADICIILEGVSCESKARVFVDNATSRVIKGPQLAVIAGLAQRVYCQTSTGLVQSRCLCTDEVAILLGL